MVFSVGVDDKSAAICIPASTAARQAGHYEDRRPASNMDPYLVTTMLAATTLGLPIPGLFPPACCTCTPAPAATCSRAAPLPHSLGQRPP